MSIFNEEKIQELINVPDQNHLLRIMLYALRGDYKSVGNYLSGIDYEELPDLEAACSLVIQESRKARGVESNFAFFLNSLSIRCHDANITWWHDPATGQSIERNKGEILALIHSEISECLEGERKSLMDDHLPHRRMAEVELADALIRIFDYAGGFGYDLGGAFEEKMEYNARRADHKPENRIKQEGKKF